MSEAVGVAEVVKLFGGRSTLRWEPRTALEAHQILLEGLPKSSFVYLIANLAVIKTDAALETALGMSLRTLQRKKKDIEGTLSREQSGRAWKFAEILAKATAVLGSREEAERWLEQPALGLDRRRPIDLLATPAGTQLVEDYLTRLEYGVYM
ncbi:MAG: hypothetical protein RLZZ501_1105 [Pseudomonadota bacterium]